MSQAVTDWERVWKQTIGEMQLQVTPDVFEMYLQPLRFLGVDGDGSTELAEVALRISAPNQFVKEWLDLRLGRAVLKTLHHIAGRPLSLDVMVLDAAQMAAASVVAKNEAGGWTLVQAGELRDPGFVPAWHDLRMFYGPKIKLDGVGLWCELRANVHQGGAHPLDGYAWPGYRGLADAYGLSRDQLAPRFDRLRDAGLVAWVTGRELMDAWEAGRQAGVSVRLREGIEAGLLRRLLENADASRLYTVNDPLELPAFCCKFGLTVARDERGRVTFDGYAGRLSSRWQSWAGRLMDARSVEAISPDDWLEMGLSVR